MTSTYIKKIYPSSWSRKEPNPYWTPDADTVMYFKWNGLDIVWNAKLNYNGIQLDNCRSYTRQTSSGSNYSVTWDISSENVCFVSCRWKVDQKPSQTSAQMQTPYCNTGWVRLDWQHGTVWKYDCFEYRLSNSRPRGSTLWLQWDTRYNLAYWYDGSSVFYFINWVKTVLYTWKVSTESKKELCRIDDLNRTVYIWDAIFKSAIPSDSEIIAYFNKSKSLYWYN